MNFQFPDAFTQVRSIWLPTNGTWAACNAAVGATLYGLSLGWCAWYSRLLSVVAAWLFCWAVMCALRSLEEVATRMNEEICADRRAVPIGVFALPAAILCGGLHCASCVAPLLTAAALA